MPDPHRNDYSELIAYLDGKSSAADGQFEGLKIEFNNNLQPLVDACAKKEDTYFQETLMLSRKVDRLER